MKIVVVGVGTVGTYLTEILVREGHDLILIEKNEKVARDAGEHFDAQVIEGDGASSIVLEPVVDERTDMFVALTDDDEVNIIATLIARKFGARRAVIRVSNATNLIHPLLTDDPQVSVLNKEMIISKDLTRLVGNPSADEIEFFAKGRVEMVKFHISPGSKVFGKPMREVMVPKSWLFVGPIRQGQFSIASGETILEPGDQVLMVGNPGTQRDVEQILGLESSKISRVILVGYNHIAKTLALTLTARNIEVRLIESDPILCDKAASELHNVLVFHGDATGEEILDQAGISDTDYLIALTDDDENNILISLLAKEKLVKRVIALAQKPHYKKVSEKIGVDTVINVRSAMVDEVLHRIHHQDIASMNILEGGQGRMMEFQVKGHCKIAGKPLSKVKLPKQVLVGAIVRGREVIIPRGDDSIEAGDCVVVFSAESALSQVKKMFLPS